MDFDCDGGLIASTGDISHCLNAGGMGRQDYETETLIAHSLRGEGFDASEDGTDASNLLLRQGPRRGRDGGLQPDPSRGRAQQEPCERGEASSLGISEDRTDCLRAFDKSPFAVMQPSSAVRRLTPRECERLQGFPDNFTQIPWRGKPAAECPDGPRYKALGNSMAVPCMAWIGGRIQQVEALSEMAVAA